MEMVYLTRRASFSASHRLWSKQLTEAENYAVYEKCANPNGHGHNYVLEVTVRGTPDPQTGMVLNLTQLKDAMHEQVWNWPDPNPPTSHVPWLSCTQPNPQAIPVQS